LVLDSEPELTHEEARRIASAIVDEMDQRNARTV
jgi:hypothetical protein